MNFFSARIFLLTATSCIASFAAESATPPPNPETVILDATGVKNLRIETAAAEPGDFEETIFALGRIDVYPGNRAAISSRIAGRAVEVFVKHDHAIEAGATAFVIESRQPGNPPPHITLTAPISGFISAVHTMPGEPVSPDKALAEIVDLRKVYALARVPEHLASRLRSGQTARVTVLATGAQAFTATLEHLGVLADPATGTVEAAFHLENPDLVLRPGMRAEFSIVTARRSGVTTVPRSALQGGPADRFVYVKDFNLPNAFVKTPVVTGQSNDRAVEIISGLFPADEVVTQGAYSLAFAGAGSLSLKEALDAAHGHEHNADGSELTKGGETKSSGARERTATERDHGHTHDDGHDHAHGASDAHAHDDEHARESEHAHPERVWMIVSGVLLIALLIVSFRKRSAVSIAATDSAKRN